MSFTIIEEIHRILKPNGILALTARSSDNENLESRINELEATELIYRPGHKVYYSTISQLNEIISSKFKINIAEEVEEPETAEGPLIIKLWYVLAEKT